MLDRNHTVLLIVDVQERMLPAIDNHEQVLSNVVKLVSGFHRLAIPMLITEQYPKGLGATVGAVRSARRLPIGSPPLSTRFLSSEASALAAATFQSG